LLTFATSTHYSGNYHKNRSCRAASPLAILATAKAGVSPSKQCSNAVVGHSCMPVLPQMGRGPTQVVLFGARRTVHHMPASAGVRSHFPRLQEAQTGVGVASVLRQRVGSSLVPIWGLAVASHRHPVRATVSTDTASGLRPRLGYRAEHMWRISMHCFCRPLQPAARRADAAVDALTAANRKSAESSSWQRRSPLGSAMNSNRVFAPYEIARIRIS
jgi:hypothetical protein